LRLALLTRFMPRSVQWLRLSRSRVVVGGWVPSLLGDGTQCPFCGFGRTLRHRRLPCNPLLASQQAGTCIEDRPPQAYSQLRTRDLQSTDSHANHLRDFIAAFSTLDEIADLPYFFGRELGLPAPSRWLRCDLGHLFTLRFASSRWSPPGRASMHQQ